MLFKILQQLKVYSYIEKQISSAKRTTTIVTKQIEKKTMQNAENLLLNK